MELKMVLDGNEFRKMLFAGLDNLKANEANINNLNVFPVPDGDTGTNMRLTLEHGLLNANENSSIYEFAKSLAKGMLLGARGNSGVILSQIFKGIYKSFNGKKIVTSADLKNAFINGYKVAYNSVDNPVEGTILTVTRLSIEDIKDYIDEKTSIEVLFKRYSNSCKMALENTPKMLKCLKDAGVIDSGGAGFLSIIEGMTSYLDNEYDKKNFKLEYKSRNIYKNSEHKKISYIAVCQGEGMAELYQSLGCDIIIDCKNTLNASTEEIIAAISKANSDDIIILPNNKNVFLTCNQALSICDITNAYMVKTKSMAEGYFALSMIDPMNDDVETQVEALNKGLKNVTTFEFAKASRNAQIGDIYCEIGNSICMINDKLVNSKEDIISSLKDALENIDLSDKEIMAVFYGANLNDDDKELISEYLNDNYSDLDIGEVEGNQSIYDLIIGIS